MRKKIEVFENEVLRRILVLLEDVNGMLKISGARGK